MKLTVIKAGMFTTVQDLGRWGYQSSGVPVAGAMDLTALRLGNIMVGNEPGAAAIEATFMGPELAVSGGGIAVFAGAELGFSVNGNEAGSWTVVELRDGDVISFKGPKSGCRGYLCAAGGVDVPLVMGSRSTYTRAKIGGFEGRALKAGDVLNIFDADDKALPRAGFSLPAEMRPDYSPAGALEIITGLQEDAFTESGLETLFSSEYTITNESDRMGCRFDGPKVEHSAPADIVSDAIPLGAVQIPGHGRPIAMLADRQTTGGYTKVGVLSQSSIARLVQLAPGSKVRFKRISVEEATVGLAAARVREAALSKLVAEWRARPKVFSAKPLSNHMRITVNDKTYDVICEEII